MIRSTSLSVAEALAELEQAALLVLVAEQEDSGRALARQRLAHALAALASIRELAGELSRAMGRPPLHVLRGGRGAARTGRGRSGRSRRLGETGRRP